MPINGRDNERGRDPGDFGDRVSVRTEPASITAGMRQLGGGWNQKESQYIDPIDKGRQQISQINNQTASRLESIYDPKKRQEEYDKYLADTKANTQSYQDSSKQTSDAYVTQRQQLNDKALNQSNNAQQTYDNSIVPQMKNAMERQNQIVNTYQQNAQGAPTLAQISDPNNSISKGIRDLYGNTASQFGQQTDQQANAYRNQGLADYGVLAALGSQATANQLGGKAFTGSQLQAAQGANNQQASQAMQTALQRVAAIQDQQRAFAQTMAQQGIQAGINQGNTVYGMGQQALGDYQTATGNQAGLASQFQNMQGANIAQQQGLRSEMGGYGGDIATSKQSLADQKYSLAQRLADQDKAIKDAWRAQDAGLASSTAQLRAQTPMMERSDAQYRDNIQMQKDAQAAQKAAAEEAANSSMWGGILGTLGTVAGGVGGAILGGPMGAMAGAGLGGSLAGSLGTAATGGTGGQYQAPNLSGYAQAYAMQQQPKFSGYQTGGYTPQSPYNMTQGIYGTMNPRYTLGINGQG